MKNVRKLYRPLRSQRLLAKRKRVLAIGAMLALGAAAALALLFAGCGGGGSAITPPAPPAPSVAPLQIGDVEKIIEAAVNSADIDMVVAVVDRAGFVLGVYRTQNAPASAIGNSEIRAATFSNELPSMRHQLGGGEQVLPSVRLAIGDRPP